MVLAAKSLAKAAFGANLPLRILNDDADLAAGFAELQGVGHGDTKRQVARKIRSHFPAFDLGDPTAARRRLHASCYALQSCAPYCFRAHSYTGNY
jgi:hypothetical protein